MLWVVIAAVGLFLFLASVFMVAKVQGSNLVDCQMFGFGGARVLKLNICILLFCYCKSYMEKSYLSGFGLEMVEGLLDEVLFL